MRPSAPLRKSFKKAVGLGAFFGLVAYGTYDLTSMGLIRDFPWSVAVVDMAWGMVVTTAACGVGYFAAK